MKISAEISLYPLHNEFGTYIIEFIKKLKSIDGLQLSVNGMSTQITGEDAIVFKAVHEGLNFAFNRSDHVIAVVKYLNKEIQPNQVIDI